jgi:DNA-binding transcriptional MerR regulator
MLLVPSYHTESGHRLYTTADVARLQQIKSLRQLGFSLEEIRACLHRPDFSPLALIEAHLARLREQMELQRRLCERLESLAAYLRAAEEVSAEEFIQTIENMSMIEKYYTPEQLEQLMARKEQVGEECIRQAQEEWPKLHAEVRAEMEKETDPASEPAQALARRWMALVHEFTGGDPGIEQSLRKMYEQEPTIHGMDVQAIRPLREYMDKAIAAAKKPK